MNSQSSHSAPHSAEKFPSAPAFNPDRSSWLTAVAAAQSLKIKTRTILLWARCGKIKGYTLTGTKRRVWRFLQSDLDDILIHSGPVISSAQPSVLADERRV